MDTSPTAAAHSIASSLHGVTVLQRGWLSSNNVLLHSQSEGAVVVDTSHVLHARQTVALLRQALGGQVLASVVNTHLHSDHCGGNAAVQRAFGCRIAIPPGQWNAVQGWDEVALSYAPTGQRCERFVADSRVEPGQTLAVGGRRWQVLAAPGHDPHSIILFDAHHGVVITADALWEHGFGVVFPELDAGSGGVLQAGDGFADVEQALDLIESLDARCAIPGHGAAFADVPGALHRARQRLAAFRADPARHARHAVKVLVKYHLLEEQQQAWPALLAWFGGAPMCCAVWRQLGRPAGSPQAFAEAVVGELAAAGALAVRDGTVFNT